MMKDEKEKRSTTIKVLKLDLLDKPEIKEGEELNKEELEDRIEDEILR